MATNTGYEQDSVGLYINKDSSAYLDYTMDWSAWLDTDTIDTSVFALDTPDADDATPLNIGGTSNTTTSATVFLEEGTPGKIYRVFNTITTAGGLVDRRSFRVVVKQREA